MNERALVLGGGGAAGNAWLIGVIAGLFESGLDVSKADLIIGTSAGSTAAAQITAASPAQLLAGILSTPPQHGTAAVGANASNLMERTSGIIDAAGDASEMRRGMGAALLEMDAASNGAMQEHWRATVAARLPNQHWPRQSMLIPAVDAHSGKPIVFDRHSGVALADAVAASCAGSFAYRIGENYYIDGGYRADVNADLAAGFRRVLIVAPLGARTRKPLSWKLHLAAQVDELRAAGSRVETIFPDSDSQNALGVGMNLMDLSARGPSARAGDNQGKAIAEQLADFWR